MVYRVAVFPLGGDHEPGAKFHAGPVYMAEHEAQAAVEAVAAEWPVKVWAIEDGKPVESDGYRVAVEHLVTVGTDVYGDAVGEWREV